MIVDCFPFFNEFDILELRLRTLENVVDRFVLCEAPFTHRGEPKPLYFAENAARFARWRDRITPIVYPGPPDPDPWKTEWAQREYLGTALAGCAPDDVILIGDCDEIPDPDVVANACGTGGIVAHKMMLMRGYLNRAEAGGAAVWSGTHAIAMKTLAGQSLAAIKFLPRETVRTVASGWHVTSLGGAAVMQRKLQAIAHAELDVPYFTDTERLAISYESEAGAGNFVAIPLERLPPPVVTDSAWRRFCWRADSAIDGIRAAQLEHAHGCFAYVPPNATVAVLAQDQGAWQQPGSARFGARFAGVFRDVAEVQCAVPPPAWVVIGALERQAEGVLGQLRAAGFGAIAFGANARSWTAFERALRGAAFLPGRAAGRAEYDGAVAASGYAVERVDRIAGTVRRWLNFPPGVARVANLAIGAYQFGDLPVEAIHDFQSDAFIYRLTCHPPPQPTSAASPAAS